MDMRNVPQLPQNRADHNRLEVGSAPAAELTFLCRRSQKSCVTIH